MIGNGIWAEHRNNSQHALPKRSRSTLRHGSCRNHGAAHSVHAGCHGIGALWPCHGVFGIHHRSHQRRRVADVVRGEAAALRRRRSGSLRAVRDHSLPEMADALDARYMGAGRHAYCPDGPDGHRRARRNALAAAGPGELAAVRVREDRVRAGGSARYPAVPHGGDGRADVRGEHLRPDSGPDRVFVRYAVRPGNHGNLRSEHPCGALGGRYLGAHDRYRCRRPVRYCGRGYFLVSLPPGTPDLVHEPVG